VAVGLAFVYVEGYGTNPAMPTHPAMLLFDAIYWSFTLVLGVADKQVTDSPDHLWRDKWTALSGPLTRAPFQSKVDGFVPRGQNVDLGIVS